jgi:uncharacterized membrane protein
MARRGARLENVRLTCLNRDMDTPAEGSSAPARGNQNLTYGIFAVVAVVGIIFAFSGSAFYPNNWYAFFKAIHVTFAVIWVGGGVSIMINAIRAQWTHDPKQVVTVAQQAAFLGEKIFAPAGLVVFLMGIAMMINTDWGWGKFWVVAGLVGYALTFVTGIAVLSPQAKLIEKLSVEKGTTAPETIAAIRKILLIARFDIAVLLLVVADMVTKPFS